MSIIDLHDIVLPDLVAFWPLAPFVWVLLAGILSFCLVVLWQRWKQYKKNAYRRAGLAELRNIQAHYAKEEEFYAFATACSLLLKRVALAVYPRAEVAGLYGSEWLDFLERTGVSCLFTRGAGTLLSAEALYRQKQQTHGKSQSANRKELIQLVQDWIDTHRV